jgi:UDP-glucuronate decarboxylase
VSTAGKNNGKSHRKLADAPVAIVAGGAGFLGSHLCARLLREGHRVIAIDNFCTSSPAAVESLRKHPAFTLIEHDIATFDIEQFEQADSIFNLACAASPIHYQRSPIDTLFSSVRGMERLLMLARRTGARIFQASTSEIYGHPTVHPQSENYWGYVNPIGPRSCYDEGKRCAETLCMLYEQEYGVRVRIARIFNTYGPGMWLSDGRVVINFIVQALADEPITLYGDGSQTRSFCYVDDLIEGIMRLMDPKNHVRGPVNLGNPSEVTVRELAETVIRLTDSDSVLGTRPLPVDDPPRRRPDIALAMRVLDWRPRVDLETGLMFTIRDVERRLADNELLTLPAVPAKVASLAGARA